MEAYIALNCVCVFFCLVEDKAKKRWKFYCALNSFSNVERQTFSLALDSYMRHSIRINLHEFVFGEMKKSFKMVKCSAENYESVQCYLMNSVLYSIYMMIIKVCTKYSL